MLTIAPPMHYLFDHMSFKKQSTNQLKLLLVSKHEDCSCKNDVRFVFTLFVLSRVHVLLMLSVYNLI
jgi:hypothetical protein